DFDDEPTEQRASIAEPAASAASPASTLPLDPPRPALTRPAHTDPLGLPTPTVPGTQEAAAPPTELPFQGSAAPRQEPEPVIRQTLVQPPLLIDVTPLTLAVETVGGYCDTVIERNTPIPCEKSRQFATVLDNQESVRVRVSQGEASV